MKPLSKTIFRGECPHRLKSDFLSLLKSNRRFSLIVISSLPVIGYFVLRHKSNGQEASLPHVVSQEFAGLPPALLTQLQANGFLQSIDESEWLYAHTLLQQANLSLQVEQSGNAFVREFIRNLADVNTLITRIPAQTRDLLYSAYGTLYFYFDDSVTQNYLKSLVDPASRKMAADSLKLSSVNAGTWNSSGSYQEYGRLADYFKALEYSNVRFQQGIPAGGGFNAEIYQCQGHNNALFFWVKALLNDTFGPKTKRAFIHGQAKPDITLVHFDSHGDIYDAFLQQNLAMLNSLRQLDVSDKKNIELALNDMASGIQDGSIDSFIVPAVITGIIGDVYWVVPQLDDNYVSCIQRTYAGRLEITRDVHNKVKRIIINVLDYNDNHTRRTMSVTVVDVKGVPHIRHGLSILDIDEDYFGARHPGAQPDLIQFHPSDEAFEELMRDTMDTIRRNLRPNLITIAQSPEFTIKGNERKITERLIQELQQ